MNRDKSLLEQLGEMDDPISIEKRLKEISSIYNLYEAAIREVKTKLENLDSDFQLRHKRDPIHSMQSRVKKPKSICEKLIRKGLPVTIDAIKEHLYDVAGIRVICHYIDDIYTVAELLKGQDDLDIIKEKDYIKEPKENGYRSLHLVLRVPVFLVDRKEMVPVEIQIRTIAMDFWASLEHQIRYKSKDDIPLFLVEELRECAQTITETDSKMKRIHDFLESLENI